MTRPEKTWQGAISTSIIRPGSNDVLNGSDKVMEEKNDSNTSGSMENPEDVDSCELEGSTEGALASTMSF